MKQTYNEAIAQVFRDEGGYSNDPGDNGGPTNWGITIIDARKYWKKDATADDVKKMPKSVAQDIYRQRYANAIGYDNLPPGVDYAVLDYGINSGVSRALKVLKQVQDKDPVKTINAIYDEREGFLTRLSQKSSQAKFRAGWLSRTRRGRKLALSLNAKYAKATVLPEHKGIGATILAGLAAAYQWAGQHPYYVIGGTLVASILVFLVIKYLKERK